MNEWSSYYAQGINAQEVWTDWSVLQEWGEKDIQPNICLFPNIDFKWWQSINWQWEFRNKILRSSNIWCNFARQFDCSDCVVPARLELGVVVRADRGGFHGSSGSAVEREAEHGSASSRRTSPRPRAAEKLETVWSVWVIPEWLRTETQIDLKPTEDCAKVTSQKWIGLMDTKRVG